MTADNLREGDCREIMKGFGPESFDSCVTDPPYELGFMGKGWDKSGIAYDVDMWKQVLRIMKPGAFLLAFGGSRTYHRMACAIEDAGFEIRDQIMWVYGSGFPKSLDVSKAIDRAAGMERGVIESGRAVKRMIPGADQDKTGSWIKDNGREFVPTVTAPATDAARKWQGWGTALKPAHEPICVARKPFKGTVADNVLRYGTGAMNIDGCRAGIEERTYKGSGAQPHKLNAHEKGDTGIGYMDGSGKDKEFTVNGRWPANFIHDGSEEVVGLFPDSKGQQGDVRGTEKSHTGDDNTNCYGEYGRVAFQKRMDSGSAARFFYCAKASRSERGEGNNHPTVKPIALMRYLCRLVTPPNGIIFDPFCGSGSTLLAAEDEGFRCVGIDLDTTIARNRLTSRVAEAEQFCQMGLGL